MLRIAFRMLKMLCFRGAAPDPAGGATAHPRPPSLMPRAFGARRISKCLQHLYSKCLHQLTNFGLTPCP